MSWMSPFTVPITILPTGFAPVSASSGRSSAMPAFIALAREEHLGHEEDAVAEVDADDAHALDEGVVEDVLGAPNPRSSRIWVPSAISSASPS